MNENDMFRKPVTKELTPQESEDNAWLDDYMARNPEKIIAPENLRECAPEIAEFEEMIASFELNHSLEELLSITHYPTVKEALEHPIRKSAKLALNAIVEKLNKLKKKTNITIEKYEELEEKYRTLSRAVGIIDANNNVDHTR